MQPRMFTLEKLGRCVKCVHVSLAHCPRSTHPFYAAFVTRSGKQVFIVKLCSTSHDGENISYSARLGCLDSFGSHGWTVLDLDMSAYVDIIVLAMVYSSQCCEQLQFARHFCPLSCRFLWIWSRSEVSGTSVPEQFCNL
eukprot:SAG31_NODE_1168_length_9568_cov_2.700708_8_plen_139_part_00